MKKIYIEPNTELVLLNIENLMGVTLSNGIVKSVSGGDNFTGGAGDVLSRRHNSIFEDDAPTSGSGSIWDE